MPLKIAINGFGRIGRTFFKQSLERSDIAVVAINDLGELENLAYLLRHDTVYRDFKKSVSVKHDGDKNYLVVDGRDVLVLAEKDPTKLPWGSLSIDVVVESTGFFTSYEKASAHLVAGAKRVVISAPAEGAIEHVLIGTNDERFKAADLSKITSDASCTTNAVTPMMAIFGENPGIAKALMTTVHAYTSTQSIVDGPGKKGDYLRGRAAAGNIVPAHTGAADATVKSLPGFKGLFDAVSVRVPVIAGSLIDLTFLAKRRTSIDEINGIMLQASGQPRWQGIVKVTDEPLTSSDILGETHTCVFEPNFTRVVDGDLVKVFAWYDNEWGYTHTLIEHVAKLGQLFNLGK